MRISQSLSGKLLIVMMICIVAMEIIFFAFSIANFRVSWITQHFKTAEVIGIALGELPANEDGDKLKQQLLETAQIEIIAIKDGQGSHVLATRHLPHEIHDHVHIDSQMPLVWWMWGKAIVDGFKALITQENETIRITGPTKLNGKIVQMEMVISDKPLTQAIMTHARNVMVVSLLLSVITVLGIFIAIRYLLLKPLGQQKRLAELGLAVSKINHDLRNILASARLFGDRLANLRDPTVQRLAPRLVRIIDRAVAYTSAILTYGKANETPTHITLVRLQPMFEEVAQLLALDIEKNIEWKNKVPRELEIFADGELMFRVLLNMCRNSVQAMTKQGGKDETIVRRLTVDAKQTKTNTTILISDTGPGIDPENREKLFSAFQTSSQGTGLGLAIAAQIIHAHNGEIEWLEEKKTGAHFKITLPNSNEQKTN